MRGWKPATPYRQEDLKASSVAAKQRRAQEYVKETEASRQKYDDKGGSPSYPRGDQHKSKKQQRSRPRISKATAKKIGDARGETHDANTEFEARDHESLQKRARRRDQGRGQHGHRPNPTRGREDTPRRVPSALSPTPRWEVTSFMPVGLEVPADVGTTSTLMVHGMHGQSTDRPGGTSSTEPRGFLFLTGQVRT